MAKVGEEQEVEEYESDPEEAKLSLISRRREASDDEQQPQDDDGDESDLPPKRIAPDSALSDYESDGQGAPAEYDDDDDEELEEYDDLEEAGETEAVELAVGTNNRVVEEKEKREEVEGVDHQFVGDGGDDNVGVVDGGTEEKKPNEPFAVPTAGAFYMHDDRFRDSAGGRNRRTPGGRKLWESKDDKKWGHDKFEEMTNQQRHSEDGRRASRGRSRGRGKNRGEERGYPRGNMPKTFNNRNQNNVSSNQNNVSSYQNNVSSNQNNALNNQVNPPKGVRGRGPKRYHSVWKAYGEAPTQNKQFGKSVEKSSYVTLGSVSVSTPSVESDKAPARKHVFSSLNSASPPFYPSSTSNKEISPVQKKDGQGEPPQRNLQTDENFPVSQSNTTRGKNVTDFMNKLYIDDPISVHSGKPLTNFDLEASGSLGNTSQSNQSRAQGRGQVTYHPNHHNQTNVPHNQVNRSSQLQYVQRAPVQPRGQAPTQDSVQQLGHRSGSDIRSSSPPKPAHMSSSFESRDIVSPPESSRSKTTLVGKGKNNVQGNGRGSFPYGGAQILGAPGNLSNAHGDQNFPANPSFLPVMQFGGQHPGGMGVPAVGMAFPGYVGNPALGNSEMTWLPVLAGTAGGLGATYPYLSLDGAYHPRLSSQISSLAGASSKENNTNNPDNELKPSQTELANDEYGQRQNKTRRYTEMKFDQ